MRTAKQQYNLLIFQERVFQRQILPAAIVRSAMQPPDLQHAEYHPLVSPSKGIHLKRTSALQPCFLDLTMSLAHTQCIRRNLSERNPHRALDASATLGMYSQVSLDMHYHQAANPPFSNGPCTQAKARAGLTA